MTLPNEDLYCFICKDFYSNAEGYNNHLNRKAHKVNFCKYEMLYGSDKKSEKYQRWCEYRDLSNALRSKPEKKKD